MKVNIVDAVQCSYYSALQGQVIERGCTIQKGNDQVHVCEADRPLGVDIEWCGVKQNIAGATFYPVGHEGSV